MPEPEGYAKRLVKGSAIVFIALVASGFIAFFLRMFLARSLSVAEYGLFYAIFALISIFGMFRDLGLGAALVKYIPEFAVRKQFDNIKSSVAILVLLQALLAFPITAALFLFSDQIAIAVFGTESASQIIKFLSIWFFTMIFFYTFQPTFQGFQNMPIYASMEFFNIFFVLLFAVLFLSVWGLGLGGVAFAYLCSSLALAVLGSIIFLKKYFHVFKEKAQITKPLMTKLLKFGLPVFLSTLGIFILVYTDTIMITLFRTLKEVGFYQAAQPAAHILWYFPMALTTVLFPMISELWVKREEKLLGQTLHFLIKFSFVLIIPAALVFIAFPEIVLHLLFPGYEAGSAALQILAAAMVITTLHVILSSTMAGIGKPIVTTKVVAVMACLNVIMNLLLIPHYGIEGAAAATFASTLIGFFLMLYFALKLVKFTLPAALLLKTISGGLLTLLLIFGLKSIIVLSPWLELLIVMMPSLLFYAMWVLVTRGLTIGDLELIKEVAPPLKRLIDVAKKLARS
ncbi:MAG: flippase [Candidatus Hodarchaeaceae archaeon]|nr:flippase [Candidatus Hodarchaeaceae archaeon]